MRATRESESSKQAVVALIEGSLDPGGGLEALEPGHALSLAGTVVRAEVSLPWPVAECLG
jgi:hypothetical protein